MYATPVTWEAAVTLSLPIEAEANKLLQRSPLALIIAMVLDQQIPLERAFAAPYDLVVRLGHDLDLTELADYDPDALTEIFAQRPALHRFPKAMAARVQAVCQIIVEQYEADPAGVWADARDGKDLLKRVGDLPGFGKQKAQIFVALLGKRYGIRPKGWREAAGAFGDEGSHRSVADIVDEKSLLLVREYKQQMKAAAAKES
jgi:uncharacterized HhH-GPD family protein